MKKALILGTTILIVLMFVPIHWSSEAEADPNNLLKPFIRKIVKPSNFENAYITIRGNEGNYALLENDFGGETYGGITRNYFPDWKGWAEVDTVKNREIKAYQAKHPKAKVKWWRLRPNQPVPDAEMYVKEFYHDWWNEWGLEQVNDSLAAIHTFDVAIMGTFSIRIIQQTLNEFNNNNFEVDGILSPENCLAINDIDPIVYLEALRIQRRKFYIGCANAWHKVWHKGGGYTLMQTQKNFLPGWLYRADKIRPILRQVLAKRMEKAKKQMPS